MRTELTFTVCAALADAEPAYPGDEAVVPEPLPVAVEPLPAAVEPLPVPLVVPVVPAVLPEPVAAGVLDPLGLLIEDEAELRSNVPVISTLWPTWLFSLSSSVTSRR